MAASTSVRRTGGSDSREGTVVISFSASEAELRMVRPDVDSPTAQEELLEWPAWSRWHRGSVSEAEDDLGGCPSGLWVV